MLIYKTIIESVKIFEFDETIISNLYISNSISEWLFVCGFWKTVNNECITIFSQFEEDELEYKDIPAFILIITRKLNELIKIQDDFVCGINKKLIMKELAEMRSFINKAYVQNYKLFISL